MSHKTPAQVSAAKPFELKFPATSLRTLNVLQTLSFPNTLTNVTDTTSLGWRRRKLDGSGQNRTEACHHVPFYGISGAH